MTESELKEVKNFVKGKASKIKDPQHGWNHLRRVADYAQKIVGFLGVEDKIDIHLLLAACYLHDISHATYSPSLMNYFLESRRLKVILPGVLSKLEVDENERKTIEKAIYSSPYSFPFKHLNKDGDLYTQILQDADTLDFFSKEREESFVKARKKYSFYAFLGLFSDWALKYGRSNLKNYLNFPQLAKDKYVQKS
ncbi:HD domain-containing protein [Patescibacteria group bacterium]|nr:HD domain-containing protein [Patescibacteria group bacterium]